MTTGQVGIVQGQTARLTLWNKGDKPILAELRFVDENGKILIQCDLIIDPGKTAVESFDHPGGANRVELRAQFRANEKREIGLLMPTLEAVEGATGATQWMIGQEGFAEFRGVPNPPLVLPL